MNGSIFVCELDPVYVSFDVIRDSTTRQIYLHIVLHSFSIINFYPILSGKTVSQFSHLIGLHIDWYINGVQLHWLLKPDENAISACIVWICLHMYCELYASWTFHFPSDNNARIWSLS